MGLGIYAAGDRGCSDTACKKQKKGSSKSMRRIALIVIICVCSMCFSGCLNAVQADSYNYVVAVGFDVGSQYEYKISMLLQTEKGGDSQTATGGGEVISAEGNTLFDAVTTIHAGGPYRLNFSRVNTIVMCEELARRGEFQSLADVAFNAIKMRRSVKLVTSTCEAGSFLQGLCQKNSQNMTKLLYDVYENYSVDGITAITGYSLFVESIRSGRSDCVMMLGGVDATAVKQAEQQSSRLTGGSSGNSGGGNSGGNSGSDGSEVRPDGEKQQSEQQYTTDGVLRTGGISSFVSGAALFDRWYMRGVLNGEDTKFLLIGTGGLDTCSISFDYGNGFVVLYLRDMQPAKVKFSAGEKPVAKTELALYCNILQYTGKMRKNEWELGLKDAAETYIEGEIERVFNICKNLNCDAFAFGRRAAMKFSDTLDWEDYDWKRRYPRLEAAFSVELKLADENVTAQLE